MKRKNLIIMLLTYVIVLYFIIPITLNGFNIDITITAPIRFIATLPIPIILFIRTEFLMTGDWKLVRIISVSYVLYEFVELLFSYQMYIPSEILGYALIIKMASTIIIFASSFLVIKYLNVYKRGGIYITITAVLLYLKFSSFVLLFFRVVDDYNRNTYDVSWDVWGYYGIFISITTLLYFVFQALALDGLLHEQE